MSGVPISKARRAGEATATTASPLTRFTRSFLLARTFESRAYAAMMAAGTQRLRMRRAWAKQLVEEILPIAVFASHLDQMDREVRCRYYNGNQNYDAKLRIKGPGVDQGTPRPECHLEVTVAGSPTDYLKREALTRYGAVHGGERIEKLGTGNAKIVSRPTAEHSTALINRHVGWIRDRIQSKIRKSYPPNTLLLVALHSEMILSAEVWADIVAKSRRLGEPSVFECIYLMNVGRKLVERL